MVSQHIFGTQVISAFLVFITLLQFFSNYRLIVRWFADHPSDETKIFARSISVGLHPDAPDCQDHETGLALGLEVPEADRNVFKEPMSHLKRKSIPALPFKNENGEDVVDQEEEGDANRYRCSVYGNDVDLSDN